MFKTFNDIYKNYPERKFIFSIHAGHSLNLSNRFGSYMKNSTYKFDNYIISLCSGEITSYREVSKGFYTLFVPALKGNSIESAVCNGKIPDPEKNNKLFRFTNMYSSDVTITIPDYRFNGFIVIKKSLPLIFSKK